MIQSTILNSILSLPLTITSWTTAADFVVGSAVVDLQPHFIDSLGEVVILLDEGLDGEVSHHQLVKLLHELLALLAQQLLAGHHQGLQLGHL